MGKRDVADARQQPPALQSTVSTLARDQRRLNSKPVTSARPILVRSEPVKNVGAVLRKMLVVLFMFKDHFRLRLCSARHLLATAQLPLVFQNCFKQICHC
jgi:hypothetical protein